ncbi:MAG: hypothetical protein M0Q91_12685 [Methanoregula sp.]|jgi:hypothetical protein|nr:hypothetical protein [Methanoregula sp.]
MPLKNGEFVTPYVIGIFGIITMVVVLILLVFGPSLSTTATSQSVAMTQLQKDPSLVAACHMEYWSNTTRASTSIEGDGIHMVNVTDLNYVCYYRNGDVTKKGMGAFENAGDANLFLFHNYIGFFDGSLKGDGGRIWEI